MHLKRKLPWILSGKALLATGSIAMVALALVTYSATVTINFSPFFTLGLNSTTWNANTASGLLYLPGGSTVPGTPTSTTSTFAFNTKTGGGYVHVGTSTAASAGDFQSFKIFVMVFNSTTWNNATMYTTSAFTTVLSGGIDGTSTANSAYIHIVSGQPVTYFAIEVSYILQGTPADTSASVVFTYTPSLN